MTFAFCDDQEVISQRSGFAPMLLYELCPRSQQQGRKGHRERASLRDAATVVVTHSYVAINKIMDHSVFQETLISHEQRLKATSFFQHVINMFPNELVEAFVDVHRSARNGVT